MDPAQIKIMEDDPRFQEEPQANNPAEVARDRLVVPANLQEETKALTDQVAKAQKIVNKQIAVSVSPSGKLRRNGPCLCGSGKKFKKCCQLKIRAGYIDPVSLSGSKPPTTVTTPPTRKLRNAQRKNKPETSQETTGQEDRGEPDTSKDAREPRYTYPKDPTR